MNIEDFSLMFTYLSKAYNKEVDKSQLKVWYDFFKQYSSKQFKNAIVQCINEKSYFPSIADIKDYIIKQDNIQVNLKADDEWNKVIDSIHTYGYYQEERALNSLEPITREIVRRIGFENLCKMDENQKYNYRSAFIKAFDSEKEDLLRYSKSNDNKSIEMQLIQERNKQTLNNSVRRLIHKIDEEE